MKHVTIVDSRNLKLLALGVGLLMSLAPSAFAQTRYGEVSQGSTSVKETSRYYTPPAGDKKRRKRMSATQSMQLSQCNQDPSSCVCPTGYMKLEMVDGQATTTGPVTQLTQIKNFKRVIRCVKPCSDGSVPSLSPGLDGKTKTTCRSGS